MGEIPSMPFFGVKLWFAVAVLASIPLRLFGGVSQTPSAQSTNSPPQQASASAALLS